MTSVDFKVTSEGVSLSIYDGLGLIDEAWYTWAELEDLAGEGSVTLPDDVEATA